MLPSDFNDQTKSRSLAHILRAALTVSALGLVLSACNTTSESGSAQTALLSPVEAEGAAASTEATNDTTEIADASVDSAAEIAAATQVASLQQMAPLPSSREAAIPAMAYAVDTMAQTSPGSLATHLAFETPANAPTGLDELIQKYAETYEVPERLVRRVVHRESRFNPAARNGPYWGLMQISHPTARGMGYQGAASGLLDAETNLKYAVKYLSGAYKVAEGDESQAVRFYARGYYYDAKRKGMLEETGLRAARK